MIKLQLQFFDAASTDHRYPAFACHNCNHRYRHAGRPIRHILNCDAGRNPHTCIRRLAEEYRAVLVDELLINEVAVH